MLGATRLSTHHGAHQSCLFPCSTLQALRQQLQGPSRHLAAKRKADVLFDTPLGAGSVAAAGEAAPAAPRFPQQPSRGAATREVAEAWARQQLASPGAPPLRLLGWGAGGEAGQVPHGFPRTSRMFELLAELAPPMPRALWFLRVICLNRTRWGLGWGSRRLLQARVRSSACPALVAGSIVANSAIAHLYGCSASGLLQWGLSGCRGACRRCCAGPVAGRAPARRSSAAGS